MGVLTKAAATRLAGWQALAASLAGAAATAVSAQIAFYLPGNPVPITMQVFAVACCGLLLGKRLGALAQVEYVLAGAAGAPVFAGFKAGPAALAGPTGGYIVGVIRAAFVTGARFERSERSSFTAAWLAGLAGVIVIYLAGRAWLAVWLGDVTGWAGWALGVAPFVGIDAVKTMLAAAICTARPGNR